MGGAKLTKNLASFQAASLSSGLSGSSAWELQFASTPNITLLDYWKDGLGEAIVSSNLDSLEGQYAGTVLTAPTSGQRPTPSANGWAYVSASSSTLVGGAALAAQCQGTAAHTIVSMWSNATGFRSMVSMANSASGTEYTTVGTNGTNLVKFIRRDGTSVTMSGTSNHSTDTTPTVTAATFDGTNGNLYWEGALIDGPTAMADSPDVLDNVSLGSIQDSSPGGFLDGNHHETMLFLGTASLAEIVAITGFMNEDFS